VPNYVIKTIYWEQYFEKIREDFNIQIQNVRSAVTEMRMNGNIQSLIEIVKDLLENLSNRDLIQMDEKNIKMIFLTLLGIDGTYFIKSTHTGDWVSAHVICELKTSHLYNKANQYIMLRRKIQLKDITKFQWLIELKYIKESEKNTLQKVKEQGLKQLQMYSESKMVKEELEGENLKKVLIVVVGKKEVTHKFVI